MPAPLAIRPRGGAGDPVATLDGAGNEILTGNLTLSGGVIYLGKVAAAPAPIPGAIALYTLDGVTVQFVAAGGQAGGQTIAGALTVNGLLTAAAGFNSTGNAGVSITGSNNTGLAFIQNTATVNAGADLLFNENAAASIALGIAVTGDASSRLTIDAAGNHSWGPGNAGRDTTLGRVSAGLLGVTTGSFTVATAGQGLRVKEGSNAKQGTSVLTAGSVVVANTSVTATSRIFLTSQADGGTPGFLRVSARTAGTSFTITSSSGTDTSTVAWEIFEQG